VAFSSTSASPNVRFVGAVKLIVCDFFVVATGVAADETGLKFASPAFVAVTEQLFVPDVISSFVESAALIAQPVEAPTLKLSAPPPLPPNVEICNVCPNTPLVGAVTVNAD
jgi:hypothetical protein